MNVVAFNGSARKDGNTTILISTVLDVLEKEGIRTSVIHLADMNLHGCRACYKCAKEQNKRCAFDDDGLNECIRKIQGADGIILGSPVYFTNVSTEMKALIDRAGLVAKVNGDMFKRKVGGSVVAVRRAGAVTTFDAMNHFFLISQMIIPGSTYWNLGIGREKGEVEEDDEGMWTMEVLGVNMAWTLKKLNGQP